MVDQQDNVIVAGRVSGANFATTGGAIQESARGTDDGFIMKLTPDGRSALFSTRLGGSGTAVGEVALSLRQASDGAISVSGISTSTDFPTTNDAYQTTSRGPKDAFIAKLDPNATNLMYSTYVSGSGSDASEHRHVLLPDGSVILVGITPSGDFPTTVGSHAGGLDGFVVKLAPGGSSLAFSRFLGGSGDEQLLGPAVDSQGNIYVVGSTTSRNLPVTEGALRSTYAGGPTDAVLFILDPSGTSILYATYLGGSGEELIRGVVVGPGDEIYLVGRTTSDDFPISPGAAQPTRGGMEDGFIMKLVPNR